MNTQFVLGIDISKRKFDVCLVTACDGKEKHRTFSNDRLGFENLDAFLAKQDAETVHACMEPTGHYGDCLALWLRDKGHVVSVVNPYRIKGFAISELQRSKTDRIDAGIIARFCAMHEPTVWAPRAVELQELQDVGRYVDSLKEALIQEQNRLKSGIHSARVGTAIEHHMKHLRDQIAELEQQMRDIVKKHKRLREAFDCLTSIIGIGEVAAFAFLGEIGYGDNFGSARQVEAYCGVNPRLRQSGTSINGRARLSKMGNSRMRKALYMPALTAMQHNPVIRKYADRLRGVGKAPMAIVGAIMRKLVRLMFAVVKSGKRYDVEFHDRPRIVTQTAQ
jgi:transposase